MKRSEIDLSEYESETPDWDNRRAVGEMECPCCGNGEMAAQGYRKPGSYRVFGVCWQCGEAVEI